MLEQAIQQRDVAAGPDREVKVGFFGGLGSARLDDAQLRARLAPRADALLDDRVEPGGVRSDENEEVSRLQIVRGRGHHLPTASAPVYGQSARTPPPRIGGTVCDYH